MATLKLDLLVDKENNRVVFAESGKDFVSILLSFLTLPIGTIVRILGKQSSLGCLDKLYRSVEYLDTDYFETTAHKTILLHPRNASAVQCKKLKINIDDSKSNDLYTCHSLYCYKKYSLICGQLCPSCLRPMSTTINSIETVYENIDPFFQGSARFIIRDDFQITDFQITPLSTASTVAVVLQQLDIKHAASLERKTVNVGKDEVLRLLKMTLLSTSPLSDVFLKKQGTNIPVAAAHNFIDMNLFKVEAECNPANSTDSKKIHMKIFYSVLSNKFLQAEAGDDLADLLFGFLTFPLGSVVKMFNKDSSLGCLDNLYKSVEHLGICNPVMLLDPKLYSTRTVIDSKTFAMYGAKFSVSDDMLVTPLSTFSTIEIYKRLNEPISCLAEMELSIGEAEALNLLKACLVSPTPLKELFLAKQGRKA